MIGSRLGPYEITAKLGEGGMGEVWRATDSKLGREVAVKVLPPALAKDADALARFEREARAVAALSHPSILAIFDFGVEGETAYAAMELLEGETLAARLAVGALPARKALEVAAQVARGLAAAHERGIVHRDLKPQNLWLTRDGQVKILDFGLARQDLPTASKSQLLAAPTLDPGTPATAPGTVLGTVGYMSPEQVRGLPADARSDLFSLGVVLHEMLTGRRAFARETAVETMTAILKEDPPDLDRLAETVSPAVVRALQHSLEKQPEERFQSARDFAFELQSLAAGGSSSSGREAVSVAGESPSRRGRWRLLASAVAGVSLGAIATFFFSTDVHRSTEPALRPSFRQLTKTPGGEDSPAVSPDGETLVFVKRDGDDLDLFTQRVDGATAMPLTAECGEDDTDPAFSFDGRSIAFRSECDGGGIFVMGATGEARRKVADFGFQPAWSPDGSELAVVTERPIRPTSRISTSLLWAVRVDSGARRQLTDHDAMDPTWSPDGRHVAFWGLHPGSFQRDLWTVPVAAAAPAAAPAAADAAPTAALAEARRVFDDPALDWAPVYSRDGRWLLFASTRGGTFNLWRLPIDSVSGEPHGEPEPLTAPSSSAGPFSLSADGRRLVFVDRNIRTEILRAPVDLERLELGPPAPVVTGSFEVREQQISPAGDWVLFVHEDHPQQLHLIRPDGSGYRQLTEGPDRNRQSVWSPSGDRIVFQTSRGDSSLATIRPDGGGWQSLGVGPRWSDVRWSPDGSTLSAYRTAGGGALIKLGADLRAVATVELAPPAPGTYFRPLAWSRDGALIAGEVRRDGQLETVALRVLATGETRISPRPVRTNHLDGTLLAFLDHRLLVVPNARNGLSITDALARGAFAEEAKVLYTPPAGRVVSDVSTTRDGRVLTWLERADESDIWLMTLDPPAVGAKGTPP